MTPTPDPREALIVAARAVTFADEMGLKMLDDEIAALRALAQAAPPSALCAHMEPHGPHDVPNPWRDISDPFHCPGRALAEAAPPSGGLLDVDAAWMALVDCSDPSHGDSVADDLAAHRPLIDAAYRAALAGTPETGLDVERLARAMYPSAGIDPDAASTWDEAMSDAEEVAAQYAALRSPDTETAGEAG